MAKTVKFYKKEMMTGLAKFLIIACALCLFSCKQKWQIALEKVDRSLLYTNNPSGWELVQEIEQEWDINYTIKKIDNDTLKVLFFAIGNKEKDDKIFINGYAKTFRCNQTDTCYLKMTSQDTLFYYRQHSKEKIFEVGEYAYRFTYLKMDTVEINYYLEHEDSLRRVKGNNLPRLSK